MRIYIFKSQTKSDLRAFTGDVAGNKLPEQFRPWHVIGVISADKEPPHKLPREQIEAEIEAKGFQLWRIKPKAAAS